LILVLGLRAVGRCRSCNIRAPRTPSSPSPRSITAPIPDVVAGFITTPLENAIAQANGIDYMNSNSQSGVSTITVNAAAQLRCRQGADRDQHQDQLGAQPAADRHAAADAAVGEDRPDHRRHVYRLQQRHVLAPNQITDYLTRVVQPKLQAVPGVQTAELLGAKELRAARLARSATSSRPSA
jgi:multidrug efflux pump